jgi:hypothetical protein
MGNGLREGLKRKTHSERGLLIVGKCYIVFLFVAERCFLRYERTRICSGKPDPKGHAIIQLKIKN